MAKNGRPPKYATELLLKDKVMGYFERCAEKKEIPNKAGLRLFLDIDKSTYSDYKKKFPNPIKRGEEVIENAWIQRLGQAASTGAIFYLKNAFKDDYRDRYESDLTSGGDKLQSIVYLPAKPNGK